MGRMHKVGKADITDKTSRELLRGAGELGFNRASEKDTLRKPNSRRPLKTKPRQQLSSAHADVYGVHAIGAGRKKVVVTGTIGKPIKLTVRSVFGSRPPQNAKEYVEYLNLGLNSNSRGPPLTFRQFKEKRLQSVRRKRKRAA
ncbi:MAG: hypothetical protein ABIH20_04545 [Candidatus Diapherotrites archaeon]